SCCSCSGKIHPTRNKSTNRKKKNKNKPNPTLKNNKPVQTPPKLPQKCFPLNLFQILCKRRPCRTNSGLLPMPLHYPRPQMPKHKWKPINSCLNSATKEDTCPK